MQLLDCAKETQRIWDPRKKTLQKDMILFLKKSQTGDFFSSFNMPEIVESDMQYCNACGNINSKSAYNKHQKHKTEEVTVRLFWSRFLKVAEPDCQF